MSLTRLNQDYNLGFGCVIIFAVICAKENQFTHSLSDLKTLEFSLDQHTSTRYGWKSEPWPDIADVSSGFHCTPCCCDVTLTQALCLELYYKSDN